MKIRLYYVFQLLLLVALSAVPALAVNPRVVMETTLGDIVFELDIDNAPISVANFLSYVDSGFYDDLIFHRMDDSSFHIIQGGGFYEVDDDNIDRREPGDPIINESYNGLKNIRGSLAMARTTDPNSATSQFYVNLLDYPGFDYVAGGNVGYAVFGHVVDGMSVVDDIGDNTVGTRHIVDNGDFTAVPLPIVTINQVDRVYVDLLVSDSNAEEATALVGEQKTIDIAVENVGNEQALDPCNPFSVALYLSDDPCQLPDDPCDTYTVTSLAGLSNHTASLSYSAPATPGEYYLIPVVDDANNILEFDETNNTGDAIALSVAPNAPDLTIGDPCSVLIEVEPGAEVALPVELRNDGGADAFDANSPGSPFWVIVYRTDDPCLSAPDPIALGDFSRTLLAARSNTFDTVTFNAPAEQGTYYLYAIADEDDVVVEYDEDNNRGTRITLVSSYEPNEVTVNRLTARAGSRPGRDSYSLCGTLTQPPTTAQMDNATTLTVYLAGYEQTLSGSPLTKLTDSLYEYRGSQDGIRNILIDLETGNICIKAKRADLTGLVADDDGDVSFEIAFSDYRGIDDINEDIINGSDLLPMRFGQGYSDGLRVTRYRLTQDSNDSNNDSLNIKGGITTAVASPNMAGIGATIQWGNRSFVIPSGVTGFTQKGTKKIYVYKKHPKSGSGVIYAKFDFEKADYFIKIKRAFDLNLPPEDFTIQFETDNDVDFDETASAE